MLFGSPVNVKIYNVKWLLAKERPLQRVDARNLMIEKRALDRCDS